MIHNICLDEENHEIASIEKACKRIAKTKTFMSNNNDLLLFYHQIPQSATFSELAVRVIDIPSTFEIS